MATTAPAHVFLSKHAPGVEKYVGKLPVVEWQDICEGQFGKRFLFIEYDNSLVLQGSGVIQERKRRFRVQGYGPNLFGASATLAGAIDIAVRLQRKRS
jgi:hypothetical protein